MKDKYKIVVIIMGIFSVIVLLDNTYAKYTSDVAGNVSTDIAQVVLNDTLDKYLIVNLGDMQPGDIVDYAFTVSNYKNSSRSEVNINYSININKSSNIPVNIALYKNGINTNVLTNLVSSNNILYYSSNQIDTYRLVVSWDNTNNNYIYSGQTDYLDIIIHGEQILG